MVQLSLPPRSRHSSDRRCQGVPCNVEPTKQTHFQTASLDITSDATTAFSARWWSSHHGEQSGRRCRPRGGRRRWRRDGPQAIAPPLSDMSFCSPSFTPLFCPASSTAYL